MTKMRIKAWFRLMRRNWGRPKAQMLIAQQEDFEITDFDHRPYIDDFK